MTLPDIERRKTDRGPRNHGVLAHLTRIPVPVLQGPFQFVISIVAAFLGAAVVLSTVFGLHPATGLQELVPDVFALFWGVLLFFGGTATLLGQVRRETHPEAFPSETSGLIVQAGAWLVLAVSPFFGPALASTFYIGLGLTIACALRLRAIQVAAHVTKESRALYREVS